MEFKDLLSFPASKDFEYKEFIFQLIFKFAPFPIAIADNEGKILDLNDKFVEIIGYSVDELPNIQEYYKKVYSEDDFDRILNNWKDKLNRALKENQNQIQEVREIKCKDGKKRIFEITSVYFPKVSFAVFKDVTDEYKSKIQLEQIIDEMMIKNAHLEALIDSTNVSIWAVDRNKKLIYFNKSFKEDFKATFGFEIKTGMNLVLLMPEAIKNEWDEIYDRTLSGERITFIQEIPFPDKSEFIEVSANPIVANNEIMGVTCLGKSITKQVLHERELEEARRKALESDKLKTAFLLNLSHEIRTPLNGILGFLELLTDPNLEKDEIKQFWELINLNSNRLLNTINDIIEMSKIQAGDIKILKSKINANSILGLHYNYWKESFLQKQIEFVMNEKTINQEIVLYNDISKIDSIIDKLISNALKFTNTGLVEIGTFTQDKDFVFYVKDTGKGIEPQNFEKIFTPFYYEENNLNQQYQGSGLGLSIAKSFAEAIGGKIWFESSLGVGSTFYFSIPINGQET